ncbi:ABC transporter permease [Bacillus smithii]|uniref:ABC transporter permease n=1 Tax=Bacillus smithii TaxID=1479 RepID=UPI002E1AFD4D|nr:ABC transporter permease [Bacillus smithii]MED1457312.1 ABC transporter permease [Bacillus smithii]
MNIINIAKKEIISDFRDFRTLIFMIAFPLVLMLVLGSALSNTFKSTVSVKNVDVLYKNSTNSSVNHYFDQFIKEASKSGIHFKKATSKIDGKKEVKNNQYDGYVEISQYGIHLYLNNRNSIEGSILQGMFTSFVDQYNIASEVIKVAPDQLGTVYTNHKDNYIKENSLLPHKQPGSMDYYAIAMTTMIALYTARSANTLIQSERVRKTANRLIASPVRKSEIFIGKILGSIVINAVCIALVIAFSKIFLKANWGNHLGLVFVVLLTEILFAISIGIGVSYLTKSNSAAQVFLMLFVQLASFFGGAYFKIENPDGILKFITELSPLTWVNTAITKIIYANDLSAAIPAMGLNIGISILFLFVSIISLQRREGL